MPRFSWRLPWVPGAGRCLHIEGSILGGPDQTKAPTLALPLLSDVHAPQALDNAGPEGH